MERKYLPTYSELADRFSICLLKSIFIPKNKKAYDKEIEDIKHDLDLIASEKKLKLNSDIIKSLFMIMLSNRYIWENESKCRNGEEQDLSALKLTHSVNGVRNVAKNYLSRSLGERVDLKIDCLAAELKSEFQNWDVFEK